MGDRSARVDFSVIPMVVDPPFAVIQPLRNRWMDIVGPLYSDRYVGFGDNSPRFTDKRLIVESRPAKTCG